MEKAAVGFPADSTGNGAGVGQYSDGGGNAGALCEAGSACIGTKQEAYGKKPDEKNVRHV